MSPTRRKALRVYGIVIALILLLVVILGGIWVLRLSLITVALIVLILSFAFSD